MCPPLCSSDVHVRIATWTYGIYGLYLFLFLFLFSADLGLFERVALYLYHSSVSLSFSLPPPLSLSVCLHHSRFNHLSPFLCLSSSSPGHRTLSFAPYCHASVLLPAIRNAAAALPRYLRDVSYAAPPTRVVSLACPLAYLPAYVRLGRKSRTGLLARCIFRGALSV